MQEPPVQSFDDPALKAALHRALDSEGAPSGLRERILAATSEAADQPIPLYRRSPLYRFAVAAILLIGFGGLAYQLWSMNRPPANTIYAIPNSLYKGMIDTHQARAKGTATPGDSVNTLAAAPALAKEIGRPAFVADLTKDGWTFQGGGVRDVGGNLTAQLFFTKGNAAVSVFSLPASAASQGREGTTYDTTFNGTPIAGFIRKGGLFCIVGSSPDGSLKVEDVKGLLDRHQAEIVQG